MTVQMQTSVVISVCSKLFKIRQRTFCCDNKTKLSLGRIIKNANKENKALFGKLLETRKERRKGIKKTSISAGNDGTGINVEVTPKKNKGVSSKSASQFEPRTEKRLIKAGDVDFKKRTPQTINKLDYNRNDGTKVVEDQSECFSTDISELRHSDTIQTIDIDNKISTRASKLLPPIVLKNIDKFPMINGLKNVETSYSLKTFEDSGRFNKQMFRMYPSVSKVLNLTMSEYSKMLLKKWREKMISELGQDGFLQFYKAQLNAGVQFHMAVQSFLQGTPAEQLVLDARGVDGCWKSLASVMPKVDNVQVLEGPVHHSDLLYHGVIDCVAMYQGEAVLIEWKKSDKPKPTIEKTYDAPIQLCAYIGAMNYDQNYPIQVNGGLVVVAYSDGSPADAYHLTLPECHTYWKLWLQRLQSFWQLQYESEAASKSSQLSK